MKRTLKWIGWVIVWLFAIWGVVITGALVVFWAKDNIPFAGCYIANQTLMPGSGPHKAAEIVLARAKQKYPQIDFSKRVATVVNLEDPIYFNGKEVDYWLVGYSETVKNVFGCDEYTRGLAVQGEVGKRDLKLRGDVEYSHHGYPEPQ